MAEPTSSAPSATTSAQGKPSSGKDSGKESGKNREDENIAKVRKKFGSLAPDELFDKFDSCAPNGVQDSMACSGDGVGQFQFFASDAKAASTTQLLTELRSSRVVEDTGRKVVGWSTLGNTAIITVVDNDLGLVMQQMVSTEEADPAKRIRELGLVDSESASDSEESEGDEGAEEDKEAEEPSKN